MIHSKCHMFQWLSAAHDLVWNVVKRFFPWYFWNQIVTDLISCFFAEIWTETMPHLSQYSTVPFAITYNSQTCISNTAQYCYWSGSSNWASIIFGDICKQDLSSHSILWFPVRAWATIIGWVILVICNSINLEVCGLVFRFLFHSTVLCTTIYKAICWSTLAIKQVLQIYSQNTHSINTCFVCCFFCALLVFSWTEFASEGGHAEAT